MTPNVIMCKAYFLEQWVVAGVARACPRVASLHTAMEG